MLVTREVMPSPGTARNFQVEAYQEAGRLLKTGIPSTLPAHPNNLIFRLVCLAAYLLFNRTNYSDVCHRLPSMSPLAEDA